MKGTITAPSASHEDARLVVSENDAANMLGLAPRTLAGLRVKGGGPKFVQLTGRRIGYARAALNEWIEARSVSSTSAAVVELPGHL